ncbi:MAG: multidrug effflux MFS transporter [Gammaproteobacteria bacterium]|nr:multidrug effflux MFS transporter [Gammaproteobacteria bacterium]
MKNIKYVLTIILLIAAINPIVGNLYLPSLPSMQQTFKTTTHLVQLTIACFALGAAIVQPFYGLLSDALGRRKVLLTGLLIAVIGSLICFLASDIYVMLSGRLIQGMGIGCTLALSRAITRDRYSGIQLSKTSSAISITCLCS